MPGDGPTTRLSSWLALAAVFASGAAALVYEVLWLKELGRLFGVTAHAAAATLAVFFLGLAAGGHYWGRRSARVERPLRAYALLELGIAAAALLYFALFDLYRVLYGPLFAAFGNAPAALLLLRLALAVGLLFPPAFLMGGTLPMMGQFLVVHREQLGPRGTLLYAVNTLGGAAGALAAGFFLPLALGFGRSYGLAIAVNVVVGLVTLAWDHVVEGREGAALAPREPDAPADVAGPGRAAVWWIALVSGFAALATEVLWVRMFAQVLENSVYTFSVILSSFLLALAAGSAVASFLARRSWEPHGVLFVLLTSAGLLVGLSPLAFQEVTSGLQAVPAGASWSAYVATVSARVAAILLLPGIALGSVFPYLLKLAERWREAPGRTIGSLSAGNTLAAIGGSLAAGFVLLEWLGLWAAIGAVAWLYLIAAGGLALGSAGKWRAAAAAPAACLVVLWVSFARSDLTSVYVDVAAGEAVEQLWEGSHGTVAVIRHDGNLRMKLNNSYTLGSSDSAMLHRRHAWLALAMHPAPRDVYHLGMGTGISSGAALDFPIRSLTVSELSPDVIEAARLHFAPFLNDLFQDPRASVVQTDGRNHLFALERRYDVVISDLFLSWKAGVGDLYTREHFSTVRERLAPGGIFVQWLPLAQLTRREFGVIARTMLDVFPDVRLWRRDFSLETPALALVGRSDAAPLDVEALERGIAGLVARERVDANDWLARIPLATYAGDLDAIAEDFAASPVNTDDRPYVEYLAPRSQHGAAGAAVRVEDLDRLFRRLLERAPPDADPYLTGATPAQKASVRAGYELFAHLAARRTGDPARAGYHLRRFQMLSGISNLRVR